DAEDVVQDAYLRFAGAQDVHNEEAFLVTVVTRLCLDRLKSARTQRELYVGPWLPEPVFDADGLSAEAATELADDLSFALMLALERLSPLERAAFLLHDVFDRPFSEVAQMVDRSEAACRQLAARARRAVRDERPSPAAAPESHARLLPRSAKRRRPATSLRSPACCAKTPLPSPTAAGANPRPSSRSRGRKRSFASSSALPARMRA